MFFEIKQNCLKIINNKVIDKIKAYEVFETLSYENIVNLYVNKIIVCSNKSAEVMFNEKNF